MLAMPQPADLDRDRRRLQQLDREGCVDLRADRDQPGLALVICVIVIFSWPYIARLVRSFTLSIREKEFVEASRSLGASNTAHHLPRDPPEPGRADHRLHDLADPAEHPLRGGALLPRARGARPPTASWGGLLNDAQTYYDTAWWLVALPGALSRHHDARRSTCSGTGFATHSTSAATVEATNRSADQIVIATGSLQSPRHPGAGEGGRQNCEETNEEADDDRRRASRQRPW